MDIKKFVIEKLGREEGLKFLEWAWPEEFNDPFDRICEPTKELMKSWNRRHWKRYQIFSNSNVALDLPHMIAIYQSDMKKLNQEDLNDVSRP